MTAQRINGARSASDGAALLRLALTLLLTVLFLPLPACSRPDPTAPRWKIHIEPSPSAPAGLDLKIIPPDPGYEYSSRQADTDTILELKKSEKVLFSATITEFEPAAYRITFRKPAGSPASITAVPALTLTQEGPSEEGTATATNHITLDAKSTTATLVVQRNDP